VFLPGDSKDSPSIATPFPRATLAAATGQPQYPLEEDQERVFNLTFPFVFAPLPIKQEGFVKVRAMCGAVTTNLGSLMIRKARPDEQLVFGFPPSALPPSAGQ
jgi:hypothetical protein